MAQTLMTFSSNAKTKSNTNSNNSMSHCLPLYIYNQILRVLVPVEESASMMSHLCLIKLRKGGLPFLMKNWAMLVYWLLSLNYLMGSISYLFSSLFTSHSIRWGQVSCRRLASGTHPDARPDAANYRTQPHDHEEDASSDVNSEYGDSKTRNNWYSERARLIFSLSD